MPSRPFEIHVPDADLDDLQVRLQRTRWPQPLQGAGWDYGANIEYVRELCDYWRTSYDWRTHERRLNSLPGFLCEVDGLDIHFWHVKSASPGAFPLLLIHGWPGSIIEFEGVVERLRSLPFDLVVPALPGFGWSGKPRERGWGISRIAAAFHSLMTVELGYAKYGVQGGDWGGIISSKMAASYPEAIAGAHLNFVIAPPPLELSDEDRAAAAQRDQFQAGETGYSNVQGTKPDSLTVAQSDSPAGLAAWIVEKFRTWSDCAGDVESRFSKDALLTNIMFYWAPNSAASAARIYFEARADPGSFRYAKIEVPTGVAVFPAEPWRVPRSWAEQRFNITRWTDMPAGGHFAAMEEPELLAKDISEFFATVR